MSELGARSPGRSITSLVGNTPLLEIRGWKSEVGPGVRIFAKLEGFNPAGSVKDRAAWNMLRRGIESGALKPGKTILDSTSGNTGIALAMLGAAMGFPVKLVMPANVSRERKRIIKAYGAEIVFSSDLEGSDGALLLCREIHESDREGYYKPDQYFNEANPEAHFLTTGPEIWQQTEGRITHLVATIGTSGTVMGTGRYLKSRSTHVEIVAVEPDDAFHGIEGLKHMASSIVPGIYKEEELDRKLGVATDAAYDMVHALARNEGLLVGQSSGAAMVGAIKVGSELDAGCIVAIFPDFGDRYLSTNLWIGLE